MLKIKDQKIYERFSVPSEKGNKDHYAIVPAPLGIEPYMKLVALRNTVAA